MANNSSDDMPRNSVFVGNEMLVVQCAADAARHGLAPGAVVSANPLVLDEAARLGLRVSDARGRTLSECLTGIDVEAFFAIGYQQIIAAEVLGLADVAVNFHDGLLPGSGGRNATTWSIIGGETEHGVTWLVMSSGEDRGNVLHEVRFAVSDDDTAYSLNARCYEAGLESFATVAQMIASGETAGQRRIDASADPGPRAERPTVFLEPNVPAADLARAVRALDVGPRAVDSVGAVRWLTPAGHLLIGGAHAVEGGAGRVGEVRVNDGVPAVQTRDGTLVLSDLRTPDGESVGVDDLERHGVAPGAVVDPPDPGVVEALERLDGGLGPAEPAWLSRLHGGEPVASAVFDGAGHDWSSATVTSAGVVARDRAMVAVASWLDGVCEPGSSLIAVTDPAARERLDALSLLSAPLVSIARDEPSLTAYSETLGTRLAAALSDGPFLADIVGRDPDLRGDARTSPVRVDLEIDAGAEVSSGDDPSSLVIEHTAAGGLAVRSRLGSTATDQLAERLAAVLEALDRGVDDPADLPLASSVDAEFMAQVNATDRDVDLDVTLDAQFRERVGLAADAPAVSADGLTLSYRELGIEVERVAALLVDAGVASGDTVGIAVERSTAMVVSVLATLGLGAHYLPLDPGYPPERLEYMVADSGAGVVVASGTPSFDPGTARIVDPSHPVASAADVPAASHGSDALAYIIYTSGSTGRPKGVELEHRQVVNFFAAMDDVIDPAEGSVWLAATSLSFDISVLELLWTLTRGLHLVVQRESGYGEGVQAAAAAAPTRTAPGTMSLFYFAADVAQAATGYRLLLESARWADEHGFEAVWTPERHFHEFGAPYPNPSVVAGALAVATERIGIRAGSVVLPLHSPVRVAEEWAVVDNLSGGRVGLSFASGWQPNDFVLRPEAYATARDSLPGLVDSVQRLWRGETVELPGHDGEPVAVSTLPRPVQATLPTWITSAGSPASFERAGRLGENLLTHLLGQSIEQLSENIARYRAAWDEAGHAGKGQVTLMLHTFLDEDGDLARETARLPLKGYLGTAVGLLKNFASAFPTFHKAGADADEAFRSLTDDEMSQLLDMAAERYLTTSGLFGTVDDATAMADAVLNAGVDEIACLIDFGIDDDTVLGSLHLLQQVHERVTSVPVAAEQAVVDESFADLVERYGVTHFQCTPSLASMLLATPRDRAALATIDHLLVGGEALPLALATELRELLDGRLTNMYGPTETTIWSLVHEIDEVPEGTVPIGRPIANTQIRIMDADHRVLPTGVYGELHIGGDGVARGYRGRPDLNAERFREYAGSGRYYATGDVVRVRPDGVVEFGGRADHQVKIRGHRIELTEIESVLDRHAAVVRSVVVAGGDGATLLAFVVLRQDLAGDADAQPAALRGFVAEHLPAVMVPSAIGVLDELPLTPNGKVDRKRLPSSVAARESTPTPSGEAGSTEELVTAVWAEHLGVTPGIDENFFDIGGHSLLAVKIFRVLGESFDGIALTDLFRFPTVRTLAAHLGSLHGEAADGTADGDEPSADTGADRGARRRRARRRS